jgi:hypothetical protein
MGRGMCTVVFLRRPGHAWPLILGANRDEMTNRAWLPPGRHWPERPEVVAGRDLVAGGSWFGLNDSGVVAGVLNRPGSLGPAPDKRSRGELVLEALDHADAGAAASALSELDGGAYRSFNLFVADGRDAYWLRNAPRADGLVEVFPVPDGVSMLTARDLNDEAAARIRVYRPRFAAAPAPDPETGDWAAWESLLAAREAPADGNGEPQSMAIVTEVGFGTTSSALLALPERGRAGAKPVWRFAAGLPAPGQWRPVEIG